jgi:hypothetical protein
VTPNSRPRSYAMISAGLMSAGTAIISSRLDRFMFYCLASGSILLTIAFSSHSLESLMRRLARKRQRNTPSAGFRSAL